MKLSRNMMDELMSVIPSTGRQYVAPQAQAPTEVLPHLPAPRDYDEVRAEQFRFVLDEIRQNPGRTAEQLHTESLRRYGKSGITVKHILDRLSATGTIHSVVLHRQGKHRWFINHQKEQDEHA